MICPGLLRSEFSHISDRSNQKMQIRGEFGDDLSVYSAATDWIKGELAALPPADLDARDIQDAAEALKMLTDIWDSADLDERRELLFTLFQDVRADPLMERITQLVPYPAYVPLLRLVNGLIESDPGVFAVAFPPEEGSQHFPDQVVQLPDPPPDPIDFPAGFSVLLPALPPRRRSDPRLSRPLQRRRKLGLDSGIVLERPHPLAPATRLDPRQWSNYELRQEAFPLDPPVIPAGDGELAVLISPFVFALTPDHHEALVREAVRVLGSEGYWLLTEPDPTAMPGYWLYRLFPAARQFDLERHLSAGGLFQLLQTYGVDPTLERQIWQQPAAAHVLSDWIQQQGCFPQLATLTDVGYQVGPVKPAANPEGFVLSQMATFSGVARYPFRPDG